MVKQLSAALLLLVSLFLFGCGRTGGDATVPDTQTGPILGNEGGVGGGVNLPTVGGVPAEAAGPTQGLNVGSPDSGNSGGLSTASGASLSQAGNDFASQYQSLFNRIGSFDPRSAPEAAKPAFNNFMCSMLKANMFQVVSSQMTLPEYVASLYLNVLKRAPESQAAVNSHASNIIANGTRVGVRGFILSDEHLNTVVKGAFRHFLGANRVATAAELNTWRAFLKKHVDTPGGTYTLERFYANIIAGSEFYKTISMNKPRNQIVNLYRYLLGRVPSAAEINYWQSARNQASGSIRVSTALEFLQSDEYRMKKIAQMIRVYWARPVTGDEIAIRLQGMRNGRDQFITMTDLLTDARYFERVHTVWNPFAQYAKGGQCSAGSN